MTIDYNALVQEALREVPRAALRQIAGNPVGHNGIHIYLGFRTDWPGVVISEALKARFPEEITIVLQHRFWDLAVIGESFTVTLTFGGIAEKLVVPFGALTSYADQVAKFSLAFTPVLAPAADASASAIRRKAAKGTDAHRKVEEGAPRADAVKKAAASLGQKHPGASEEPDEDSDSSSDSNIVSFDRFRK